MKAFAEIDAGICGFKTSAHARSDDEQSVTFDIESDCDKIRAVAAVLKEKEPIDAYMEIDQRSEGALTSTCRSILTGCCAGCAVPAGLFKAMQVAAGLALPKDAVIRLGN